MKLTLFQRIMHQLLHWLYLWYYRDVEHRYVAEPEGLLARAFAKMWAWSEIEMQEAFYKRVFKRVEENKDLYWPTIESPVALVDSNTGQTLVPAGGSIRSLEMSDAIADQAKAETDQLVEALINFKRERGSALDDLEELYEAGNITSRQLLDERQRQDREERQALGY
jgi:hypothetical protein